MVIRRERLGGRNGSALVLDPYLEALMRRQDAFSGSTALEQARPAGRFTPVHDKWWAAAKAAHGDAVGTRNLIEVLLHGTWITSRSSPVLPPLTGRVL